MSEAWVALSGVKGGPAIRPGSSMPTSVLLRLGDMTVLVDAGLGAAKAVCDQGVALTEIDLVLITHLHSDHYLELGPLFHTAWTAGLSHPIPVIGPSGLADYWSHFLRAMAFDINLRVSDEGRVPLAPLADIRDMRDGRLWDRGVRIDAIRNNHPPIADSFGLCIEGDGRKIVLSGDTAPFEGWQEFCAGADLLVHEAMLVAGVDEVVRRTPTADGRLKDHILRSHTDAVEVGRLARDAGVSALALNHFVPEGLPGFGAADWEASVRRFFDGRLVVGHDGLRITL